MQYRVGLEAREIKGAHLRTQPTRAGRLQQPTSRREDRAKSGMPRALTLAEPVAAARQYAFAAGLSSPHAGLGPMVAGLRNSASSRSRPAPAKADYTNSPSRFDSLKQPSLSTGGKGCVHIHRFGCLAGPPRPWPLFSVYRTQSVLLQCAPAGPSLVCPASPNAS